MNVINVRHITLVKHVEFATNTISRRIHEQRESIIVQEVGFHENSIVAVA